MKKLIGLLGGLGSRASALIYQRTMEHVEAKSDADYPRLLVYNHPFQHASVSCEQTDDLTCELNEALGLLDKAGCSEIWTGCNSIHTFTRINYPIIDAPSRMMAMHREFFRDGEPPLILSSTTTAKHVMPYDPTNHVALFVGYPGPDVDHLIQAIIDGPPTWEHRAQLADIMRRQKVVLACTELSVIFWSMSEQDRLQFPNVLDTSDFIAQQIAKS